MVTKRQENEIITDRRNKVYVLFTRGLGAKDIAKAIDEGRWHYRTIEDDIRYLRKGRLNTETPDWFLEARATAIDSIEDLKKIRDKANELIDDKPNMPTITKLQVYRLVAEIDGKLVDKLLPSQSIIENVGDSKVVVTWGKDAKDFPLCTKCGKVHDPNVQCEPQEVCDIIGDRSSYTIPAAPSADGSIQSPSENQGSSNGNEVGQNSPSAEYGDSICDREPE